MLMFCRSVPSYGALIAAVSMRIALGIAGFHAQPHAARPRILKGEVAETISDVDSLDPGPHTGNGQRRSTPHPPQLTHAAESRCVEGSVEP